MRRKLIAAVAAVSAVVIVFAAGRAEQAKRSATAGRPADPTDAVLQSPGGPEVRAAFKGTTGKTQSWFLEDRTGPVVRSGAVTLRTTDARAVVSGELVEVGVGVYRVNPSLWTGDGVYRATFTPHVGAPSARDVTIHLPNPLPE